MSGDAAIKEWLRPNQRLINARETVGLSQEELAMLSRVSRSTIGLVERLSYKPGADIQVRIATAVNMTVTDIWPNDETSPLRRDDTPKDNISQ